VSVVVPARNERDRIGLLLESLLHQTKPPLEIIVVDNGSTDGTAEVARSYGVKVITEPVVGVAWARNTGAAKASGDILVFVDADCVAGDDYIELIMNCFLQDPKLDVCAGAYEYRDGGRIIRWLTGPGQYLGRVMRLIKLVFGVQFFLGGNVAIKRRVFEEVRGWNENEKMRDIEHGMEDVELALRLQGRGYRMSFRPELAVVSSWRRVKRSPQVSVMRVLRLLKYLYEYRR